MNFAKCWSMNGSELKSTYLWETLSRHSKPLLTLSLGDKAWFWNEFTVTGKANLNDFVFVQTYRSKPLFPIQGFTMKQWFLLKIFYHERIFRRLCSWESHKLRYLAQYSFFWWQMREATFSWFIPKEWQNFFQKLIAGQERFGNMTRVYYKEAAGAIVVFDTTRAATFEGALKWKADLDQKLSLLDGLIPNFTNLNFKFRSSDSVNPGRQQMRRWRGSLDRWRTRRGVHAEWISQVL